MKGMLVVTSVQIQLLFTKYSVKHEWIVLSGNPPPPILTLVLSLYCRNRFFFFVKYLGPTPFCDTN
jgi:hypothetical protein